jgi:hypothetical protein
MNGLRHEDDEYPLAVVPTDIPSWSENYAIMFADPVRRAAILYLCGRWHADPTIWREVIGISLPGDRILYAKNYGRGASPRGPGASLSRFEVTEPGRTARLTFDGPVQEGTITDLLAHGTSERSSSGCAVDLVFEAATPIWNMDTSSAAAAISGSLHIEQIGRVDGMIEHGGERFVFDRGYGIRDHSRGPRHVSRFKWHCWLNALLDDGRAIFVYAMQAQGADAPGMLNASIVVDGVHHRARVTAVEAPTPADLAKPYAIGLESDLGAMTVRVETVVTDCPMSFVVPFDTAIGAIGGMPSGLCHDQCVRVACDGVPGIGWSERGYAERQL